MSFAAACGLLATVLLYRKRSARERAPLTA
jgi:hypothetical protein